MIIYGEAFRELMDGAWPQILDQTDGIAEQFNHQVTAGQSRGACAELKCPSNMSSDGC